MDARIGAHRPAAAKPMGLAGFTMMETLVTVGILTLVLGLILVVIGNARRSAEQSRCLNNLRQIGLALHQFTLDNQGRFPNPQSKGTAWEHLLRSYVNATDTFRCGADNEVFPAVGSSYDWRDTGKPETTLAGKDRASVTRTNAVMAFEALPDWHAKTKINAVWVDGSAHVMDREICIRDLTIPVR